MLRAINNPQFAELVAVHWDEPDGTIHYTMAPYDELPEYANLTLRPIDPRFNDRQFQTIQHTSGVADSSVTLDFADDDDEIARLCNVHGEGVRVEIFFYFPQVDLLLSRWWGHLASPDDTGSTRVRIKASFGFRSAQLSLPKNTFASSCPWTYGGKLKTLEEVAENACPYNRHLGGEIGLLDEAGLPILNCKKNDRAECKRHFPDDRYWGGADTVVDSYVVGETKGPNLFASSRGNESNLKRTRRVIAGEMMVRDMDLLAFVVEADTKHPDKGSAKVLFGGIEGPILSMSLCTANNLLIGFQHLNVRLGELGQARTSFTANVGAYSMMALFYGVIQGDYRSYGPSGFQGSAKVKGLRDLRVYTDENTYTKQYTVVPAWWVFKMLTDKNWGDGQDYSRFVIQDWIDAAAWHEEFVGYSDPSGNHYTSVRAQFHADILERTTQQQINDACLYSRLTPPFPFQGKTRIMPLRKEDLSDVPVFTDEGDDPNILVDENGLSTLRTKKVKEEGELTNYIQMTFFDAAHGNLERPLIFEDEDAQFAAGRAFGDSTRRVIKSEKAAFGVTDYGQAVRGGQMIRDLGENDEGGLVNNREVTFTASILDTLELHMYKVIKVVSSKIERYLFQYFRIQGMEDASDLTVHIRAVAYPEAYYERLEDATLPPPTPGSGGDPNPGGGRDDLPCKIGFSNLTHTDDHILFKLEIC